MPPVAVSDSASAREPGRPSAVPLASDGRVPGPRGLATRQRLIDTVADMLDGTPYREIRVTDIARAAGTSPATFYQYFIDVEEVVLTLAEDTADIGARLVEVLDGRKWRGAAGWQSACALVDGFLDFWRQQQPVLRVVDLLTEEGDARFRRARVRMLNTVTVALAEVIAEGGAAEDPSLQAMAMAGALVSMLAHVASHQSGFEAWDIHVTDVREAMARLLYWGVTGPRVPAH
jgi:AcrR family transcriptional regulator